MEILRAVCSFLLFANLYARSEEEEEEEECGEARASAVYNLAHALKGEGTAHQLSVRLEYGENIPAAPDTIKNKKIKTSAINAEEIISSFKLIIAHTPVGRREWLCCSLSYPFLSKVHKADKTKTRLITRYRLSKQCGRCQRAEGNTNRRFINAGISIQI